MIRVLNVGAGSSENPKAAWPDEEVEFVRLDANKHVHPDIVHNVIEPLPEELIGQFDVVYSSHMLEHIGWRWLLVVMHNISLAAKPDGKLYFVVPDLEWGCKQVLQGNYNYGVLGVLYGGQSTEWDYHRCGFTRSSMNIALKRIGWRPVAQQVEPFIATVEETSHTCYQIATLAERYGTPDPAFT